MEKTFPSEIKKHSKFIFDLFLVLFFLVGFCLLSSSSVQAANLYISPSSGSYLIGDQFSVGIYVSSTGQAMNAASGALSFSPDKLGVLSVSKNGTIFTVWTQEPSFSNSSGIINFEGIVVNPGFTGSAGKIITIILKAKAAGDTSVNFSAGSVLANDGKGTNILADMNGANFYLGFVGPQVPEGAPAAPKVFSDTHPDPEKWYSNNDPQFKWEVSEGITGVRLSVDQKNISIPEISYPGSTSEKKLEDLNDGVWYFHIQLQDKFGWGAISNYKFNIDTTPPESFELVIKEGEETVNPQPILILEAIDKTSGIDFYEVKIDQESPIIVKEKEYKIPAQSLGKHTIIARAVDKAGNERLEVAEINILPIETPTITDYPKTLLPDSIISIEGTAAPESKVKIHVLKDGIEIKIGEAKSNTEGKWSYTETKPVEKGVYIIWVEATDSLGGKSASSDKITIQVTPSIFIRIGKLAIDYLATIITLLILIFGLILGIIWIWRKIKETRRKLKKEITEAEKSLYFAFKMLKEGTERQISKLDGESGLSEREKKIASDLKEALNDSEKNIGKEIRDIEKELE